MLLPMLAKQTEVTSLEHFITNNHWVMEQKLDGHRLLLTSPGGDFPPSALTRNGTPYTRKLPEAIRNFRFPVSELTPEMPGAWVLDGELVGGTLYVFDLPHSPLDDYQPNTPVPLIGRRAVLETLLDQIDHPFKLVPQAITPEQKIKLAETALKNNFEGLILKRVDSPYRSGGRTDEWLKVKFVSTADCIVTGVRTDGKDSVDLGLVDAGQVIPVGRASLIGKEKKCTILAGDIVEVRYLYTGAGGRLYQPTILRRRDDKRPDECTTGQLKYVNKDVLEVL